MIAEIRGTGAYIPAETLDNHELSRLVETSDEWIRERTGIVRRHIAVRDTTSSMAAGAAAMALESAGISPNELDLILVSTISPDRIMPGVACVVQKELGAKNALCFDLNAACSGFVLAYHTACAYLESGFARNALIVGSECLSNLTNWEDRTTCILFGDGAGAAVLSAAEGRGFQPVAGSDGALGEALTLKSRHDHSIFSPEESRHAGENSFMEMDGQAVFRFAVKQVPPTPDRRRRQRTPGHKHVKNSRRQIRSGFMANLFSKNYNKRTRFTRMCIGEAVFALMDVKEYEKIKVSDIVKRAGVSRMTFYHYYETKEDALADFLHEIVAGYVRDRVAEKEKVGRFQEMSSIIDAMNEYMMKRIQPRYKIPAYELYFYGGALLNVFIQWEKGGKKEPVEEIAKIIAKL